MSSGTKELFKIIAIVVFIVISVFLYRDCENNNQKIIQEANQLHNIEYKVDGNCVSASLTYRNIEGGTEQIRDAVLPWSYKQSITTSQLNKMFFYISAQNDCQSGQIISSIYVDGNQIKSSKSSGAFVIASASTSYPPR